MTHKPAAWRVFFVRGAEGSAVSASLLTFPRGWCTIKLGRVDTKPNNTSENLRIILVSTLPKTIRRP